MAASSELAGGQKDVEVPEGVAARAARVHGGSDAGGEAHRLGGKADGRQRVEMAVVVDEARGHDTSRGVHGLQGGRAGKITHAHDAAVLNGHVRHLVKAVGRVQDPTVPDDELIHGVSSSLA